MEHIFRDKVTITPAVGVPDHWGRSATQTPQSRPARINEESKLVMNNHGQEVMSNASIEFPGQLMIGHQDEITWTDAAGTMRVSRPLKISPIRDGIRVRMTVVDV